MRVCIIVDREKENETMKKSMFMFDSVQGKGRGTLKYDSTVLLRTLTQTRLKNF